MCMCVCMSSVSGVRCVCVCQVAHACVRCVCVSGACTRVFVRCEVCVCQMCVCVRCVRTCVWCVSGVSCVYVVSVCVGEWGKTEIRQAEPYETTLYSGWCQWFDTRQEYPEQKLEGIIDPHLLDIHSQWKPSALRTPDRAQSHQQPRGELSLPGQRRPPSEFLRSAGTGHRDAGPGIGDSSVPLPQA